MPNKCLFLKIWDIGYCMMPKKIMKIGVCFRGGFKKKKKINGIFH